MSFHTYMKEEIELTNSDISHGKHYLTDNKRNKKLFKYEIDFSHCTQWSPYLPVAYKPLRYPYK